MLKKVLKPIDIGCPFDEIKVNFEDAINTLAREFIVELPYPGCLGQVFSWNSYLSQQAFEEVLFYFRHKKRHFECF